MNLHKKFLFAAVIALSLFSLLAVVGVLGFTGNTMDYSVLSALSLAYFCLAAFVGAMSIERRRLSVLSWFAIAWAALAFMMAIGMLWWEPLLHRWFPESKEESWTASGFYFSFLFTVIILLWLPEHVGSRASRVRWIAVTGAMVVTWFFIDGIFGIIDHPLSSYYWRVCSAISILTGCVTILFPIVLRIDNLRRKEQTRTTSLTLDIKCPRCGLGQSLSVGHHKCNKCRLRISIDIEEPRCPKCNYIFYEGVGKQCPECGHSIPEEDRWLITKLPE